MHILLKMFIFEKQYKPETERKEKKKKIDKRTDGGKLG